MPKIVLFTFFILISFQSFCEVLENGATKNEITPEPPLNAPKPNLESDDFNSQDVSDEKEFFENQIDQPRDDGSTDEEDTQWD